MKRITTTVIAGLAAIVLLALTTPAFAEGKEETITGKGLCAKCMLHETDKCQNAIQVEKNGKTTTYYLTDNDVSKDFHHDNLCKESKQVTATGTVKKVHGKMEMTVSKIELAKQEK
ncbi:MAG TPA: DUF6370 family protein [Verrucomicrobiae bacterium]|nr:DUF6370 family protein [Verrucomicrobiae bacterium]